MKEPVGRVLRHGWIAGVVGYSALRLITAWGALGRYGVDPFVFGAIDIATAYPYACATAAVVSNALAGRTRYAIAWSVVALAMFAAPYAYVLAAGGEMPASIRLAVLAFAMVMAMVVVVVGLVRRARRGARAIAA
jgi:hypothetical protein